MSIFTSKTILKLAVGLVTALALSFPALSSAQQGELDEITVTARKRVENLQDLALSVSAMGAQEIQNNFATDLRDLVYISPNTVLDDTNQGPGGVAAAYIRGIGVSEVEKNFDPAVGVVVDGIFRGTMTGSIQRALDLERIEILRGPQGTLFGRNTIGGVIILERSKPTMTTGAKIRASVGDYDTTGVDGLINFGNGETFGAKITAGYRKQGEGFSDNLVTGSDEGRSEYNSAGLNLLWAPTQEFELEFTYDRERTDQDTPPLLNVGQPGQLFCDAFGMCSPDLTTPISGDRYAVVTAYGTDALNPTPPEPFDPPGYAEPHSYRDATFDADTTQLELRWDLNDVFRFDYVVGSWKTEETVVTDWDAVPQVMFHTDRPAEYNQTTHEIRLTYDAGESLTYTAGVYSWDSDYENRLRSYIGFAVPGLVLDLPQKTIQTNKSTAFFVEGDYRFGDGWTMNLGGRYTEDKKTTDQSGVNVGAARANWSEFTPKASLTKALNDDSMIYVLYSGGYRAGGFNGRVDSVETATTPYNPETVDNIELGYRSEWANRTLIFNATLFAMDYKDKQEEIQAPSATSGTGQVTRVVNASTATIQGLEVDLMWLAAEGLTLRANLGLLDASYDSFLVNTGTELAPVMTDFSNLNFRRAPEVTASLSGSYEWEAGEGSAMIQAGWRFLDEHEIDFANKPELTNKEQHLVDASFNYSLRDWRVSVFGRNLLEEDGYQIGFDVAGLWSYAAPRAPRTFGVEVGYSFGD